jgi:ribosomal protein L44E
MGIVAVKDTFTGIVDRGRPTYEVSFYIYCDQCGSFNVKRYISFYVLLILAVIVAAGILVIRFYGKWGICFAFLIFIALRLPLKDLLLGYQCRKCGNTHMSSDNSLNYPSYDLSVVDVPDHLIQKRCIYTDTTHFQEGQN